MNDPDLAHRAEQALLGALIARQGEIDGQTTITAAGGLRPQDFTDSRHQAIYAALTGQGLTPRGGLAGLGERLRDMLARLFSRQARELAACTAGLPACCPDPAHLDSYAGMVAAARGQRTAQALANAGGLAARGDPRLESAAAWLDAAAPAHGRVHRGPAANAAVAGVAAGPVTSGSAPARPQAPSSAAATPAAEEGPSPAGPGPLPAGIARLARLLRPAIQAPTRQREQPRPPAGDPQDRLPGTRPADRVPARDSLQEQVLAGLMHDPGVAREVTAWLPAAVFSSGIHRGLYGLICSRLVRGQPVDPLILAWEASLPGGGAGSGPPAPGHGESLPAAVLRIGQLHPDPETAAVLGQALYAGHLCGHVFGPGWEHTRGPAHLAAAVAQPARLAPGPAVGPATSGRTALPDTPVATEPAVRPAQQQGPAAASAPAASPAGHPEPAPATAGTGAPRQPGRAPTGRTPARPAPPAPARPAQPGQTSTPVPAVTAQRM